jgi:hypothetical protein
LSPESRGAVARGKSADSPSRERFAAASAEAPLLWDGLAALLAQRQRGRAVLAQASFLRNRLSAGLAIRAGTAAPAQPAQQAPARVLLVASWAVVFAAPRAVPAPGADGPVNEQARAFPAAEEGFRHDQRTPSAPRPPDATARLVGTARGRGLPSVMIAPCDRRWKVQAAQRKQALGQLPPPERYRETACTRLTERWSSLISEPGVRPIQMLGSGPQVHQTPRRLPVATPLDERTDSRPPPPGGAEMPPFFGPGGVRVLVTPIAQADGASAWSA